VFQILRDAITGRDETPAAALSAHVQAMIELMIEILDGYYFFLSCCCKKHGLVITYAADFYYFISVKMEMQVHGECGVDLLAAFDMDLMCKLRIWRSSYHLGYLLSMYFPFIVLSFRIKGV
jgi:hypothetical protein